MLERGDVGAEGHQCHQALPIRACCCRGEGCYSGADVSRDVNRMAKDFFPLGVGSAQWNSCSRALRRVRPPKELGREAFIHDQSDKGTPRIVSKVPLISMWMFSAAR